MPWFGLFLLWMREMFEDLAVSAANFVLVIFWVIIMSMVIWGAWWLHNAKSSK
jgi:hypothetical protein